MFRTRSSSDSINQQLYRRACELGVKFYLDGDFPGPGNGRPVLAMSCATENYRYKLYGWRFFAESRMENRTAYIDFNSFTDAYSYARKRLCSHPCQIHC